jgi:fatty acid CoA ligase FadD9
MDDELGHLLKLAQGEFVAVANLEAVYGAAALVRQIFVYGNSEQPNLLAVIVPAPVALAEYGNTPALKAGLRQSLQRTAAAAELQPYEVPVDFLIETEPFTAANGLLSGEGKLLWPRLKEHYGERLEQMYADITAAQVDEIRMLRQTAPDRPVVEKLVRASRALLDTAGGNSCWIRWVSWNRRG